MAVTVNGHTYYTEKGDRVKYLVPLTTVFKGVVHRSVTEADQHVIMDGLDLRTDWEPYGIELPSGEWYKPDVYVRDSGILVEVKRDGEYDDSLTDKHWEAMEYFNDPDVDKVIVKGYENHPIKGMVISPRKQYLNDPDGQYGDNHRYYKPAEDDMYEYILKILGVENDDRFLDRTEDNINFDHIRRVVMRAMKATYDHGGKPLIMGFRDRTPTQVLIDDYGTDKLSEHDGDYLWDYMDKHQHRQLSNKRLDLAVD